MKRWYICIYPYTLAPFFEIWGPPYNVAETSRTLTTVTTVMTAPIPLIAHVDCEANQQDDGVPRGSTRWCHSQRFQKEWAL